MVASSEVRPPSARAPDRCVETPPFPAAPRAWYTADGHASGGTPRAGADRAARLRARCGPRARASALDLDRDHTAAAPERVRAARDARELLRARRRMGAPRGAVDRAGALPA